MDKNKKIINPAATPGTAKIDTGALMHTMPAYFRDPNRKNSQQRSSSGEKGTVPKKQGKKSMPLIIGVVFFVVLSASAGTYYWSVSQQQTDQAIVEEQTQEQEVVVEQDKTLEEIEAEKLAQELKERDQQRIKDIHEIQVALEFYYDDFEEYPEVLPTEGAFIRDGKIYLESMPQNPEGGGIAYQYSRVGDDGLDYELVFSLEESVSDFPPGSNIVTAQKHVDVDGFLITRSKKIKRQEIIKIKELLSSRDSDLDGLTDLEEDLYDSNKNEFDSDLDSYSDKQELLNLYDPVGKDSKRLLASGKVQKFENDIFGYSVFYPTPWNAKTLDQTKQEMVVTTNTGEIIQITVEDNREKLKTKPWIERQFEGIDFNKMQRVQTAQGLVGVKSIDRRTAYFIYDDVVYIINHNVGEKETVDYDVSFNMMIKSFNLVEFNPDIVDEVVIRESLDTEESTEEQNPNGQPETSVTIEDSDEDLEQSDESSENSEEIQEETVENDVNPEDVDENTTSEDTSPQELDTEGNQGEEQIREGRGTVLPEVNTDNQ